MSYAGLGLITTPDFTIWTPARRRAWLDQIHSQVNALTGDIRDRETAIRAMANGPRFMTDWAAFKNAWTDFYRAEIESSLLFSGTTERAQEFVNRYNALEARYTTLTGARVTSAFTPSTEELPETTASWANRNLMIWAGLGIVGLGMVGWIMSNAAYLRRSVPLNNNRRSRRRRRR